MAGEKINNIWNDFAKELREVKKALEEGAFNSMPVASLVVAEMLVAANHRIPVRDLDRALHLKPDLLDECRKLEKKLHTRLEKQNGKLPAEPVADRIVPEVGKIHSDRASPAEPKEMKGDRAMDEKSQKALSEFPKERVYDLNDGAKSPELTSESVNAANVCDFHEAHKDVLKMPESMGLVPAARKVGESRCFDAATLKKFITFCRNQRSLERRRKAAISGNGKKDEQFGGENVGESAKDGIVAFDDDVGDKTILPIALEGIVPASVLVSAERVEVGYEIAPLLMRVRSVTAAVQAIVKCSREQVVALQARNDELEARLAVAEARNKNLQAELDVASAVLGQLERSLLKDMGLESREEVVV